MSKKEETENNIADTDRLLQIQRQQLHSFKGNEVQQRNIWKKIDALLDVRLKLMNLRSKHE